MCRLFSYTYLELYDFELLSKEFIYLESYTALHVGLHHIILACNDVC